MAAFVQYHPDGDYVHLLDADPDSESFQQFVAKIPLAAMSETPRVCNRVLLRWTPSLVKLIQ